MPNRCLPQAMLATAALLTASTSLAGDDFFELSLQSLVNLKVTTASQYEQYLTDAPSVISVITRADIENYGYQNLLDILQRLPGFVPVGDVTFGQRGAALRGDTNISRERVLTLIDGRPFRSLGTAVYTSRALYNAFPVESIERIELIRGPGSAVYGTNAVTGVINIITRTAEKTDSQVKISRGSFNNIRESVFHEHIHDKAEWVIAINRERDTGWSSQVTTRAAVGNTEYTLKYRQPTDEVSAFGSLKIGDLEAKVLSIQHQRNFVRPIEAIDNDRIKAKNHFADVGYQSHLNENLSIDSHYSYLQVNDSQFLTSEESHQLDLHLNMTLPAMNARFSGGLTGVSSEFATADKSVRGFKGSVDRSAFFGQWEQDLIQGMKLYAGLQWNQVQDGEEKLTPRLGWIYNIHSNQGIKLLYNEAFRSPTPSETQFNVFIEALGIQVFSANPDLKSETVATTELQWFSYQNSFHLTATLFNSDYKNRINNDFSSIPASFSQKEDISVFGVELEGKWLLGPSSGIDWYFTQQQNENQAGDKDATLAPSWTLGLGGHHRFNDGTTVAVFNQYVDGFKDNSNANNNAKPDAYHLLSAKLSLPLHKLLELRKLDNLSLSVFAQNLLNEDIRQPEIIVNNYNSFQAQAGRTAYASLEFSW